MVTISAVALNVAAQVALIVEDFDYGATNYSDVPDWFDTVATEAWSVFYDHSGDANSPHDYETGGVGFQNGTGGHNHYLYRSIGTYAGEDSIAYGMNVGKWNGAASNQSGEMHVRVYRNNTIVPGNDVDLAADAGSLLVDSDIHAFTLYTNEPLASLWGTLDLSGSDLSDGDQLYFQLVETNPHGNAYVLDDVEVVPQPAHLLFMHDDFDYGTANRQSVPYWYDSFSTKAWAVFYNLEGNSNSAFDYSTGSIGFQGGAWAGTNQYLYCRVPGVYGGELSLSYSFKVARWNTASVNPASDMHVRVFRNNTFVPGDDLDVAADPDSLLLDARIHSFESATDSPIVEFSGTLALPKAGLSRGDVLYFEIVNANTEDADFNMDDVVLVPSSCRMGDVSTGMTPEGNMELFWQGSSNAVFSLQKTDDLVASTEWSNVVTGIAGADEEMSIVADTGDTRSFYRVAMDLDRGCLMEKHAGNPLLDVRQVDLPQWRWMHAANVSILDPSSTPTGKWMMYLRGSGRYDDGNHNTIGLFEQEVAGFDPFGPWDEYAGNPVISYGEPGSIDEHGVLDTSAMRAVNGNTVIYVKGKDYEGSSTTIAAVSSDGYTFEKLADPISDNGPCEAVYHDGLYYLYTGNMTQTNENGQTRWILQIMVRTSDQYGVFTNAPAVALTPGAPGTFDSKCVYGGKIFKVTGDSRWFMVYQASNIHIDYPDLFHVAWSTDLLHWTKVKNELPLLVRGNPGEWDQGAMWTGSVIEHNGSIYIYYEAWGSYDLLADRDAYYYPGGNSRVGVASVSVGDFLDWVDGSGQ